MIRQLEKKNWRKNIDKCWNVSADIQNCLAKSRTYQTLSDEHKQNINFFTGRGYITTYLSQWASGRASIPQNIVSQALFSDPNWQEESLGKLKDECNLNGLIECCKETYNLDNLEGDYQWAGARIKK